MNYLGPFNAKVLLRKKTYRQSLHVMSELLLETAFLINKPSGHGLQAIRSIRCRPNLLFLIVPSSPTCIAQNKTNGFLMNVNANKLTSPNWHLLTDMLSKNSFYFRGSNTRSVRWKDETRFRIKELVIKAGWQQFLGQTDDLLRGGHHLCQGENKR